jgi:predicted site-specific integrase-resolvase
MDDHAPGEKLLTKGEVAQLCRVEVRTIERWVAAGKLNITGPRVAVCCFAKERCADGG